MWARCRRRAIRAGGSGWEIGRRFLGVSGPLGALGKGVWVSCGNRSLIAVGPGTEWG